VIPNIDFNLTYFILKGFKDRNSVYQSGSLTAEDITNNICNELNRCWEEQVKAMPEMFQVPSIADNVPKSLQAQLAEEVQLWKEGKRGKH